jgi:hypothetical protein
MLALIEAGRNVLEQVELVLAALTATALFVAVRPFARIPAADDAEHVE